MKPIAVFFAFAIVSVVLVATALAQPIPDLNLSQVSISSDAVGASVTVDPDGGGASFTEAYAPGGGFVDATITVQLVWSDGNPVVGWPTTDMWLETTSAGLVRCDSWGTYPDGPTNDLGVTVWQNPKVAGGCSVGEQVLVMVNGAPIIGGGVDIVFRSPDLNGDRDVNLSDIVAFTQMISSQNACGDFTNDGTINLSDIVIMTGGIGAFCLPAD